MAASRGCDLLAVAANFHAAPATAVGLGAVVEPQHAGVVFAALHQLEGGTVASRSAAASATGARIASAVSFRLTFSICGERGLFQTSRG